MPLASIPPDQLHRILEDLERPSLQDAIAAAQILDHPLTPAGWGDLFDFLGSVDVDAAACYEWRRHALAVCGVNGGVCTLREALLRTARGSFRLDHYNLPVRIHECYGRSAGVRLWMAYEAGMHSLPEVQQWEKGKRPSPDPITAEEVFLIGVFLQWQGYRPAAGPRPSEPGDWPSHEQVREGAP
jgi:hypothetical protein